MGILQRFLQAFKTSQRAYKPRQGVSSASRSHQGCVRKKNEDAVLSRPDLALWVVADGMGGHLAGDYASQCIVECMDKLTLPILKQQGVSSVENILRQADQAIRHYGQQVLGGKTVGSTVCVLLLEAKQAHCFWMGDSRIYCFRQGQLTALSSDHSQAMQLFEQGLIPAEEVDKHPSSHVLTRAMGCNVFDLAYRVFDVQAGDKFLLCSDGLYAELSVEDMSQIIAQFSAEDCAEKLVQRCLERGARDNVSLVCINTGR